MPKQPEQPGAKDHARLRSLIDKLVAVQLDLKPLCRDGGPRVDPSRVQIALAAACEVLQLAIEDVRDIIHKLDARPEIGAPVARKTPELPPDD